MGILLMVHSILRWIIVLVAVVAAVKFALGVIQKRAFDGLSRGLMAGFGGLMDLQAALGLVYLIWNGLAGAGFPLYRIAHGLVMLVAAALVHLNARWKSAAAATRYRNNLWLIVGVMALVFAGVFLLPGGLARWYSISALQHLSTSATLR
jgi:hypothetical protein